MSKQGGDKAKAIEDAETMRQTHVDWLEHLAPTRDGARMKCEPCRVAGMDKIVGDAAHHEECIERYDNILACLVDRP